MPVSFFCKDSRRAKSKFNCGKTGAAGLARRNNRETGGVCRADGWDRRVIDVGALSLSRAPCPALDSAPHPSACTRGCRPNALVPIALDALAPPPSTPSLLVGQRFFPAAHALTSRPLLSADFALIPSLLEQHENSYPLHDHDCLPKPAGIIDVIP